VDLVDVLSGQEAERLSSDSWDEAVAVLRVSPEDRSRPMPLWALVSTRLESLIETGRMPQGSRIENEVALAEKLGISRPTMRRALQELVDKGLLLRKPGVGTRVISASVRRPVELTSLYDDLVKSGREPRSEVLSFAVVPASDALALSLRIPPRSDVTSIRRLRFANDEPLALMTNQIPIGVARLDPDELERHGLYECIRAAGGPLPSTAQEVIGARLATAQECAMLGMEQGSAVLTMTRTAWGADGRGIELGSHIYRADRYAFEHHVKES
jgi:DNA-binding GntR family transcriptional regulator